MGLDSSIELEQIAVLKNQQNKGVNTMLSSTIIIDQITDRITKKPTNPADTLYSRRRHSEVEISGDALVFPLEDNVVNPAFVEAIRKAQNAIFKTVEEDPRYLHKRWDNKAERHQEKHYKRHKKLHLAFLGTIPIGTRTSCEEIAKTRTPKQMIEAQQVLNEFVNQENIISGNVKECKWNEDGHLVVRVDINPAQALFDCKAKLHEIFGSSYNRYDDPEKQRTLASVIGVIDPEKISLSTKSKIDGILKQLEIDLKTIKPLFFTSIEWIVYDKRTLSENSRLFVWSSNRANNPMHDAIAKVSIANVHPASLFYLPASEEMKTSHQNAEYHPASWRRSY